MRALYRTVSALLAIVSGLAFALLINAVTNDGEIKTLAFVIFAIGAVIAAVAAIVLWSKTLRK